MRIDTKYNVIWILGQATAGETNSLVTIHDTLLRKKLFGELGQVPHFPTYFPNLDGEDLPNEFFVDDLHNFNDPTILFKEEE